MYSSILRALISILIFLLFSASNVLVAQEDFFFKGTYEDLAKEASEKGFGYVIEIKTDWCGYCKKFERSTLRDPLVVDYLNQNKIRFLAVNGEKEGTALERKHGVNGYPTILFFEPDGEAVKRINGYQSPQAFLHSLKEFMRGLFFSNSELSYIQNKNEYFDSKEFRKKNLNTEILEMARSFGLAGDIKSLRMLELEIQEEEALKARLYFLIYNNKKDLVPELAWMVHEKKLLNPDQMEFVSFYAISKCSDYYLSNNLIHNSIREESSLSKLDTKAGIEFFSGNKGDARSTLKKIAKESKKSGISLPPTYESLRLMIDP